MCIRRRQEETDTLRRVLHTAESLAAENKTGERPALRTVLEMTRVIRRERKELFDAYGWTRVIQPKLDSWKDLEDHEYYCLLADFYNNITIQE